MQTYSQRRRHHSRVRVWSLTLAALVTFLGSTETLEAQSGLSEAGRILGRAIAAGVVLATDDFAASGRYSVDDDAESSFSLQKFGIRHDFERPGRWRPFLGFRLGQVEFEQQLDVGANERAPLEFEVWGFMVEGGARYLIDGPWFIEFRGEVGYSFADNRLEYPPGAGNLAPAWDGVLFNWDAEAVSLEGRVVIGWTEQSAGGITTELTAEVAGLRTDPVRTDDPIQDVTVDTHFERLSAGLRIPLGGQAFGAQLRLDPRLRHTFLAEEISDPLDSGSFTDLGVALLSLRPEGGRLPISAIGIAATYTTADSFDGWSIGVAVSR
jgi:hypothetical protein